MALVLSALMKKILKVDLCLHDARQYIRFFKGYKYTNLFAFLCPSNFFVIPTFQNFQAFINRLDIEKKFFQ